MTRLLFFCFFLVFLRPTLADPPLNGIYLGKSQILEANSPRQISLNAHVSKWDAQPGGLEIAYQGGNVENGQVTEFVKLAGVKRGETVTLATRRLSLAEYAAAMGMNEEHARKFVSGEETPTLSELANAMTVHGWSGDGRYFLVGYIGRDSGTPDFACIDVTSDPPRQRPLTLTPHDPNSPFGYDGNTNAWWSPKGERVVLERYDYNDGKRTAADAIYNPAANRLIPLAIPEDLTIIDWIDDTHLLMRGKAQRYVSFDVDSGKETVLTTPNPKAPGRRSIAVAPKNLTLTEEYKRVADQTNTATTDAHAIWIRRQNGPKILSAFPVALTPGPTDPQSGWLPGGKRVAYVAHGDLFVVDLIVRPAAAREKLAAGESLTCAEERDLAISNVKQIVLGMLQWCQDNDEFYPPAAGVEAAIIPYTKDPSLFSVGTRHFVYTPPVNRSLAALENPATTIIGTIDLPCAVISAYADGHVKSKMKPGFE